MSVHKGRTNALEVYRGRLTPQQVTDGINLTIRNARRLAVDASLMLDFQSYPTAASLAALAIEEIGKVSILRRLACARTDAEANKLWRSFRDHRSKNGLWIIGQKAAEGSVTLDQLADVVNPDAEHTVSVRCWSPCVREGDVGSMILWRTPSGVQKEGDGSDGDHHTA